MAGLGETKGGGGGGGANGCLGAAESVGLWSDDATGLMGKRWEEVEVMMGLPLSDGVKEADWDMVGVSKGNSDRGAAQMRLQVTYKHSKLISRILCYGHTCTVLLPCLGSWQNLLLSTSEPLIRIRTYVIQVNSVQGWSSLILLGSSIIINTC